MRRNRSLFKAALGLLAAAAMAVPGAAQAAEDLGEFPLVKAQRPLALHPGKLRLDLPLVFQNIPSISIVNGVPTVSDEIAVMFFGGVEYGVIDNLSVGGTLLPVRLTPDADYLNPSIFGLYQLVRGQFELGARATIVVPIQSDTDLGFAIGLPAGIAINDAAYLSFEPAIAITLADPDTVIGLSVPIELTVNVNRPIFLHFRTGFMLPNFDVSDAYGIPLGFGAGYTLGEGNDPMMDIFLNFDFSNFYNGLAEEVDTDFWTLALGVNWFIM